MKSLVILFLVSISLNVIAGGKVLLKANFAMSSGENGGVEYDRFTAWPDENPGFRGRGLSLVKATLVEEENSSRVLTLSWHDLIRPVGADKQYPYNQVNDGNRRNLPLEDLTFEATASKVLSFDIKLERGRSPNTELSTYTFYSTQIQVGTQFMSLRVRRLFEDSEFEVILDTNQPGDGTWSERLVVGSNVSMDLKSLVQVPNPVEYRFKFQEDLSASDQGKIESIKNTYAFSGRFFSEEDLNEKRYENIEKLITSPKNFFYLSEKDETFLQTQTSLAFARVSPLIHNISDNDGNIDNVVLSNEGEIIALVSDYYFQPNYQVDGCVVSVLQTLSRENQPEVTLLTRGYCF